MDLFEMDLFIVAISKYLKLKYNQENGFVFIKCNLSNLKKKKKILNKFFFNLSHKDVVEWQIKW